jgi:hypothetical protein
VSGKAIVTISGKRGVLPSGKAGVTDADGRCANCGCGGGPCSCPFSWTWPPGPPIYKITGYYDGFFGVATGCGAWTNPPPPEGSVPWPGTFYPLASICWWLAGNFEGAPLYNIEGLYMEGCALWLDADRCVWCIVIPVFIETTTLTSWVWYGEKSARTLPEEGVFMRKPFPGIIGGAGPHDDCAEAPDSLTLERAA